MNNMLSFKNNIWKLKELPAADVSRIATQLNISETLATLLVGRGLTTEREIKDYLGPRLDQLPSPFLLKGMDKAVRIICESLENRDTLMLYGDYDVDGVTSISVIANFLHAIGHECILCHPNRLEDGYGVKEQVVDRKAHENGVLPGLLITCDSGISDIVEVAKLNSHGWKVIVTDHHQPPDILPEALAIVNPWLTDSQFPFKDLAGVGVAFYLIMALRNYMVERGILQVENAPNLKRLLDLVAIGTICDMVEVRGANRIMVKAGLEVLLQTENLGLQQLMKQCNFSANQKVSLEDISFKLGPRLNAPGRMGRAELASKLLTSRNFDTVNECIHQIEEINTQRRTLTFEHIEQASLRVEEGGLNNDPCLIVYDEKWHIGLIGIIASKLVDVYDKPTIALCGKDVLKGSVRSIEGLNFHDILAECADTLIEFGGHSAACGFSVKQENLERMKGCIFTAVEGKQIDQAHQGSTLLLDHSIENQHWKTNEIEQANNSIQPYGFNNFEPIYTLNDPCELRNIQFIGKEKAHVRFQARLGDAVIGCIGFGLAKAFSNCRNLRKNSVLTAKLAFNLRKNCFNNTESDQLFIHDLILTPQRN